MYRRSLDKVRGVVESLQKELAHRLVEALQPMAAWIVENTGLPKKGTHSIGVGLRAIAI